MRHADALSRCTVVLFGFADSLIARVKRVQDKDEGLLAIKRILKETPYEDYMMRDEILFKFVGGRELLVIPKSMQQEIIKSTHEKGHYATKRTEEGIKQQYYIPGLAEKVKKVIGSWVKCLIGNRKAGNQEGLLHPLFKESQPLHTYHLDHVGPLNSTQKGYNHILVIVDSFSKYTWLYPVKTTKTIETLTKLELRKTFFGNPAQMVTDRGTSFTSKEFKEYCEDQGIKHCLVTTGLPRANGQVERINAIVTSIVAKLSTEDPTKWYKVVPSVQVVLNSTYQRSIGRTPFELLTGVKMRNNTDLRIAELLKEEAINHFEDERDQIRQDAKLQILKTQDENRKYFNKNRKEALIYNVGDLVAVKRTQIGPGLKLKAKFLGPYQVTKVKSNDTYNVEKRGSTEGPKTTTTCAEYMKPWPDDDLSSGSDDVAQDGRMWEDDQGIQVCRK